MKKFMTLLFSSNIWTSRIAFFMIRVGIGLIFVIHGMNKLHGGTETFVFLGSTMKNLGITFMPLMWGIIAVMNELISGSCIAVGFATRFCAALLTFQMVVALMHHITKGDAFTMWSNALLCMIIFVALVIAGGGYFSIDNCIVKKNRATSDTHD